VLWVRGCRRGFWPGVARVGLSPQRGGLDVSESAARPAPPRLAHGLDGPNPAHPGRGRRGPARRPSPRLRHWRRRWGRSARMPDRDAGADGERCRSPPGRPAARRRPGRISPPGDARRDRMGSAASRACLSFRGARGRATGRWAWRLASSARGQWAGRRGRVSRGGGTVSAGARSERTARAGTGTVGGRTAALSGCQHRKAPPSCAGAGPFGRRQRASCGLLWRHAARQLHRCAEVTGHPDQRQHGQRRRVRDCPTQHHVPQVQRPERHR
jgi:hypothetical protein